VIDGQAILESGFSNLGEALRSQAIAGTAGFNQQSTLSGGGSSSIDLRNLGDERVLVLINGKRVASFADSLGNQAIDLQFLPQSMIERVDILRDGASAVYGSDAISGVVNVILKERFEGVEFGAGTGISGEGDGQQYNGHFVMGTTSDRGSIMLGAEYSRANNIPQRERDWAKVSISSLTSTVANGSFFHPGGIFFANNGGVYCRVPKAFGGDEITNNPACPSRVPRQSVTSPKDVRMTRYDYALEQDLYIDNEVYTAAAYGVYDLTEDIEAFMELQYAKRQGISRLDGNPGSFGTPSFPNGTFVPGTNPNLGTLGAGFFYFRPSSTIGIREERSEADTLRLVTGFRGDIANDSFLDGWSWELSYLYTRMDADLGTNATWNLARFLRISDPAQCALDPNCRAAVNRSGALDVIRPGNWTQSEIEYMRQITLASSEFQTTGWYGMATGPIFELPAGEVQLAIGAETRTDRGKAIPDPVTEAGESVANQTFTSAGDFTTKELFAELEIPILADMPGAQQLDLNLQGRYSDYNTFGSESVWRAGINWQVIEDVRIRASMSTAYRSPVITDLFGGGTTSFDFFTHPCVDGTAATNANVRANCALDGIPATANLLSTQFAVLSGSNPDLQPESADTSTIGIVFTPRFLEGLSISLDFWDIEVENLITRITSDSILDACYAGPAGKTAVECTRFRSTYNAQTNVLGLADFTNRLINDRKVSTNGYDLGIGYQFDLGEFLFNLDFQGTYLKENTFYPGVGGADDRGSIPRIRANINLGIDWHDWDFDIRTRYIHSMSDPRFNGVNAFGYENVRSHTEIDLRVAYNFDKYRAVVGVNDLFDKDPPYIFSSGNNTDLFLYSAVGRYFFLRLSASM
jgi:outer membrane receptor protein involved in Fe transport